MTKHGHKIPGVTVEQVREQLADETDAKAIKRLTAARKYLDGLSPADIEDKYGWNEKTVYGWLNRFEERGFEAALYDDNRPGQDPELAADQFDEFAETLHQPPEEAGTMSQHGLRNSHVSIWLKSTTRHTHSVTYNGS